MGSSFAMAVKTVFSNEGGLTDNPKDPGGITNLGITLDVLRREGAAGDIDGDGDVDADDIRLLTVEDAGRIYNRQWWLAYGYSEIENQWIATKQFDLSVNLGPFQAHIITQRALRSVGVKVVTDGILGPITKSAINRLSNKPGLIAAMRSEAAGVYRLIVVKKPVLNEFLTGWLNRAYQ